MAAEVVQMPNKDLAKHEKVISDGLRTFVDVGRALAAIQDGKLYKGAGFETFEAYCKTKWDLSSRRAYQLVTATTTVENVKNFSQKVAPPATESHAAALAKLPPKQQAKAWAKAVKTAPNGTPTAKHVTEVVTAMLPKPKPRVHECPQHGCKFDDGQECPVCKDRREKGLDATPQKSEPRRTAPTPPVSTPAVGEWECEDCGTVYPDSVEECGHCTEPENEGDDAPAEPFFNPQVKASDLYDFTVGLLAEWPDPESYQPLLDVLGQLQVKIEKLEAERCK